MAWRLVFCLIIPFLGVLHLRSGKPSLKNKPVWERNRALVVADSVKNHQKWDIDSLLNSYVRTVQKHKDADTLFYPCDTVMDEDFSRIVIIGKLIDTQNVYAVDISAPENATIHFYLLENEIWKKIGSENVENTIYRVEFNDLDGDGRDEIITKGFPNMNGNYWNGFFYCSEKGASIQKAGGFFSGQFEVKKETKTIEVRYQGSWYMDEEQAIYEWRNGKLVPLKKVVKGLKKKDLQTNKAFIEYYENPTFDTDTLVLKFRKTYRESNRELYDLWENFLSTKYE